MDLNDKVTQLEDEIKILKNEIQSVLLDLRESFLNNINPFNPVAFVNQVQPPAMPEMPELLAEEDIPVQVLTEEPEALLPEIEAEDANEKVDEADDGGDDDVLQSGFDEDDEMEDDDLPVFGDLNLTDIPDFLTESNGFKDMEKQVENMVWHPETANTTAQFRPSEIRNTVSSETTAPDLNAIAELSKWVESSVRLLGTQRTRTILDITETMGYINSDLNNILVKFIHPVPEEDRINATTRDYLASLVDLNKLLKCDSRLEVALLFILILCQEYDNR